jgi:3-hydroxybutyryl-CoA dehydrogenase
MGIKTVGIVGAGQVGKSVAQLFAQNGYSVILNNLDYSLLEKAKDDIAGILDKRVARGKVTEDQKKEILQRIHLTVKLAEMKEADFVLEAVIEELSVKLNLFEELDGICQKETILVTNTGSFTIATIADATRRPDKVMGMHFMNPAPLMQLVEMARGPATSEETFKTVKGLAEKLGKTPIVVDDSPGFVTNRVLQAMINEAIYCLYEGLASAEEIDEIMKLGMNYPMGPLAMADFIGLDTVLFMLEYMHVELKNAHYKPCPLLKQYVEKGHLGKKSGKGFYHYIK